MWLFSSLVTKIKHARQIHPVVVRQDGQMSTLVTDGGTISHSSPTRNVHLNELVAQRHPLLSGNSGLLTITRCCSIQRRRNVPDDYSHLLVWCHSRVASLPTRGRRFIRLRSPVRTMGRYRAGNEDAVELSPNAGRILVAGFDHNLIENMTICCGLIEDGAKYRRAYTQGQRRVSRGTSCGSFVFNSTPNACDRTHLLSSRRVW